MNFSILMSKRLKAVIGWTELPNAMSYRAGKTFITMKKNRPHREKRKDPNKLYPGDKLWV